MKRIVSIAQLPRHSTAELSTELIPMLLIC
eukprot:COSAG01_NODE_69067_length_262_cov_0.950920_1_plen_29_part_01